jgi:hypothetical protein
MAEAPKRTKDKVCIVGCADTKNEAPWHLHEEFEFWGVNNLYLTLPDKPFTRWFEIHLIEFVDGVWLRRKKPMFRGQPTEKYLQGLGRLPFAVYMQAPNPLVPNAVQYPLSEIVQEFGTYFTNTISYEIALAMLEGFKEIRIYGVDMAVDSEWFFQRPSCEYFLGVAVGRGVKIWIPDAADLLKNRFLYGFQEREALPYENKLMHVKSTLERKRAEAMKQKAFLQKQEDQYIGAMLAMDETYKIWKNCQGA